MAKTIQVQVGTFKMYGSLVPVFTTIYEAEIKEFRALGLTRTEAIDYLTQ